MGRAAIIFHVIYKIIHEGKLSREEVTAKTFAAIIIKNYQKQAIKSMISIPSPSTGIERDKQFFNAQLSVHENWKF